jgi:DNA-binding response OmpR family regulator
MKTRDLRILVVEDNPLDIAIVEDALAGPGSARFAISTVDTLEQAVDMVCRESFEAVLLDLGLPDSQGLDTFLGLHSNVPDLPVVVVSGLDDESLAVEAVRQGAQDYLVKGQMNAALLSRSLVHAIERQRLLVKLREAQSSLKES